MSTANLEVKRLLLADLCGLSYIKSKRTLRSEDYDRYSTNIGSSFTLLQSGQCIFLVEKVKYLEKI